MPLTRLRRAALLACLVGAISAAGAAGAIVEVNDLVLHADGGFTPRTLPKVQFAPIDFKGYFHISSKDGARPAVLNRALLDFDRDGRLSAGGLPTCAPAQVAAAGVEEARRLCRGAIVGEGKVEAQISLAAGTVAASSPLTIFNGPPVGGHPTAVIHARTSVPSTQTYAIVVPIEKQAGEFRYRVTVDIPPLAAGLGALTHLSARIGRHYSAGGQQRSYVSARCSDGILRSHASF
nr:hypothetical protein [Solirubrobacterales bacterium]